MSRPGVRMIAGAASVPGDPLRTVDVVCDAGRSVHALSGVGGHQSRVAGRWVNDPNRPHAGVTTIRAFKRTADFVAGSVWIGPGARHAVCDCMPSQCVGKFGPIGLRKAERREEGRLSAVAGMLGVEKVVPDLFISHKCRIRIWKRIIAAHSAMASASTVATVWKRPSKLDQICPLVRVDVHDCAGRAAGE